MLACYNDSRVFYACCTISMHYRYSGCHAKIGNFIPEKFHVPHIALKYNLLKKLLKPKNYIQVPEWQDDSWSGNCQSIPVGTCHGVPVPRY